MMTDKTPWTPGPWAYSEGHIQRDSGGIRYWQIDAEFDAVACNQFCYAGSDPAVNEANARLIATAPELIEALELWIEYDRDSDPSAVDFMLAYDRALTATKAAIRKARGGS